MECVFFFFRQRLRRVPLLAEFLFFSSRLTISVSSVVVVFYPIIVVSASSVTTSQFLYTSSCVSTTHQNVGLVVQINNIRSRTLIILSAAVLFSRGSSGYLELRRVGMCMPSYISCENHPRNALYEYSTASRDGIACASRSRRSGVGVPSTVRT